MKKININIKKKNKGKTTFHFEVKTVSDCFITAQTRAKALEILKENWLSENNIELVDEEIKLIKGRQSTK